GLRRGGVPATGRRPATFRWRWDPAAGRPNGMFSAAVSSRMPTEPSGWSERTTTVRRTVIVDAHDLEEKQMLNWLLRARRARRAADPKRWASASGVAACAGCCDASCADRGSWPHRMRGPRLVSRSPRNEWTPPRSRHRPAEHPLTVLALEPSSRRQEPDVPG